MPVQKQTLTFGFFDVPSTRGILYANIAAPEVTVIEGPLRTDRVALRVEVHKGIVVVLDRAQLLVDSTVRTKQIEHL